MGLSAAASVGPPEARGAPHPLFALGARAETLVPDSGRPLCRERLVATPQNVPDSGRPLRRERLVAAPQNVPDSGRPLRRKRLVVNTRVLRM